jgi:hypothetical protein
MSLIQPGISHAKITVTNIVPVGITGDELPLKLEKFSDLTLGEKAFHYRFGVWEIPTKADDLLGTDFLAEHEARFDFANRKQEVRQSSRNRYFFTRSGDVAFKIFPARVSQAG